MSFYYNYRHTNLMSSLNKCSILHTYSVHFICTETHTLISPIPADSFQSPQHTCTQLFLFSHCSIHMPQEIRQDYHSTPPFRPASMISRLHTWLWKSQEFSPGQCLPIIQRPLLFYSWAAYLWTVKPILIRTGSSYHNSIIFPAFQKRKKSSCV